RTTIENNGKSRTWDLHPNDDEFSVRFVQNLSRKFKQFYKREVPDEIEVLQVDKIKQLRVAIKDTFHRAYLLDIRVRAHPDVLRFAYDCGLGEKNSMGFGMVRCRGESS
ncbi:MAG: CRISPR-associated endoribonuclease Cas6, partial [Candidatus Thorarchaeota archaeon]